MIPEVIYVLNKYLYLCAVTPKNGIEVQYTCPISMGGLVCGETLLVRTVYPNIPANTVYPLSHILFQLETADSNNYGNFQRRLAVTLVSIVSLWLQGMQKYKSC
jgi:hypothetical protein